MNGVERAQGRRRFVRLLFGLMVKRSQRFTQLSECLCRLRITSVKPAQQALQAWAGIHQLQPQPTAPQPQVQRAQLRRSSLQLRVDLLPGELRRLLPGQLPRVLACLPLAPA